MKQQPQNNSKQFQPQQIPELYTNAAEIKITPYDILMKFGLTEDNKINPLINVRMSPLHAKVFSKVLNDNIKMYEQRMGEIKIPDVKNN